jgi:spermidine synthase
MQYFFAFFLVSGFCSLVYEVVWLRLAMAKYGVTTPTVSIVLSVFMAGLAIGSWVAGLIARRLAGAPRATLLRAYALTELCIAFSGVAVPAVLGWGRDLLGAGGGGEWGSSAYYLASSAWISAALLPFCCGMGATFPFAIGAIRRLASRSEADLSFGYLYVANVLGAALGTLASAFVLIEVFGFRGTLAFAAGLNALLGLAAYAVSLRLPAERAQARPGGAPAAVTGAAPPADRRILTALFTTGFVSMAMEVSWVRQFTPYLGTVVYSFASILAAYLVATFVGSRLYRFWLRSATDVTACRPGVSLFGVLGLLGVLPLVAADYRVGLPDGIGGGIVRVVLGIALFCAALGFVTPLLVDRWSHGDPQRVGAAYAVNVVGCILGPLAAGFLLLPKFGERWGLFILASAVLLVALLRPPLLGEAGSRHQRRVRWIAVVAACTAFVVAVLAADFEGMFPGSVVRRDSTATVIAWGQGRDKRLLVNGIGMTALTPITKMMAHLPLAFRRTPASSALTICFGMGTSFRSVLSWGIRSRSVELVPSVPMLFGYFHPDGPAALRLPGTDIVIDDGRRYLERSRETYDVVVVDPPPPTEAAGSSLLYSREFYGAVKNRLRPGGVVQQWVPAAEPRVLVAFAKALRESFPYVRVFGSVEGWGLHFLASMEPIPAASGSELAGRMPPSAMADLLEWGPASTAEAQFNVVLAREISVNDLIRSVPGARPLEDDRPINEYYFLRRTFGR